MNRDPDIVLNPDEIERKLMVAERRGEMFPGLEDPILDTVAILPFHERAKLAGHWQELLPYVCRQCHSRFFFGSIAEAARRGWPRFASLRGHRCYVPDLVQETPVLGMRPYRPSTGSRFMRRTNVR